MSIDFGAEGNTQNNFFGNNSIGFKENVHVDKVGEDIKNNKKEMIVFPKICPFCNMGMKPINPYNHYNPNNSKIFISVFICTICSETFIAKYSIDDSETEENLPISIIPKSSKTRIFPENILKLSNRFCIVYNQSLLAEQQDLYELCGFGYRKALEILIKDYAIKLKPDSVDKIIEGSLGHCIEKYYNNSKIKELAKAASWIGNDEAHYERKNKDLDVDKMKNFIDSVVSIIDAEINYEKAINITKKEKTK